MSDDPNLYLQQARVCCKCGYELQDQGKYRTYLYLNAKGQTVAEHYCMVCWWI